MKVKRVRPPLAVFALAVLGVLLGGCGDTGPDVTIHVDEHRIEVTPDAAKADTMSMDIDNEGSEAHALVIVRAEGSIADLPLEPNGAVDLDRVAVIDRVPAIPAGVRYRATVPVIQPGDFYIICIVAPEGGPSHFQRGMHARVRILENPELNRY